MSGAYFRIGVAFLFALAHAGASRGPVSFFSAEDKGRVMKTLLSGEKQDGTFGTVEDTFFTVSSLKILGKDTSPKSVCRGLSSKVSEQSILDLYHAISIGCKLKMTKARISTIQSALDGDSMDDAFMAASAISNTKISSKVNLEKLKGNLAKIKGGIYMSPKTKRPDAAATGLAYKIADLLGEKSESSATALMKLGKTVEGGLYFASPGRSRLSATTIVLQAAISRTGVTADHLDSIASFVASSKYVKEPKDIFNLLSALSICTKNKVHIPLVLSIEYEKGVASKAVVSDVMGGKAPGCKITLVKTTSRSTKKTTTVNKEMPNGKFQLDSKPGVYDFEFKVEPKSSKSSVQTTTRAIKIFADAKPTAAVVVVGSKKKSTGNEMKSKTNFPKSIPEVIVVDESQHVLSVKVAMSGKYTPEQMFLRFTHRGTGKSAVFVFESSSKGHSIKLNLGSTDFTENTFGLGLYTLSVIVGGELLPKSYNWEIGTVEVTWPAPSSTPRADAFAPRPEISHIFNTPDKTPNALISLIFTALALAPLGIVFVGIHTLGITLKLPEGTQGMYAMVFQGSLLAIVFLNLMYFLSLNIFEAGAGLVILSIVAILSGNKALNYLHSKANKQKKE